MIRALGLFTTFDKNEMKNSQMRQHDSFNNITKGHIVKKFMNRRFSAIVLYPSQGQLIEPKNDRNYFLNSALAFKWVKSKK